MIEDFRGRLGNVRCAGEEFDARAMAQRLVLQQNIQYLSSIRFWLNGRLANLLEWLGETAPDIACLQELKAPDEKFPAASIRAVGYGAVWRGQKSWNGWPSLREAGPPSSLPPNDAFRPMPNGRPAGLVLTLTPINTRLK